MTNKIRTYKKDLVYSYTSGASPTFELIKTRPGIVDCIYIHSQYRSADSLVELCGVKDIPVVRSDRVFETLNQKENSYVLGVFRKYSDKLSDYKPHVVLVNPSDMGNVGTIIRTMAGFGINDLAIIEPAADIWNPKTIRASMGALFHIRHQYYSSFEDYAYLYPNHSLFPFMLTGAVLLEQASPCPLFSLIFGNEASGLDESFSRIGRSVKIPHMGDVDSFNLSVAVGIGLYAFTREYNLASRNF